jgi:hypothetical protein
MVHGKSESRRTIAGWTKLSAFVYRRDWPRDFCRQELPGVRLRWVAINSSSAAAVIAEPWRAMKAAHFGGEDIPLHAN